MEHRNTLSRVIVASICSLLLAQSALAKTYYVSQGQSIQAVINSAAPGDRVQVAAGTYNEAIEITKNNIDLRGTNSVLLPGTPRSTRCDPNQSGGICISGTQDAVLDGGSVTGFVINDMDQAISISYARNVAITSNRMNINQLGIVFQSTGNLKIQSNQINCQAIVGGQVGVRATVNDAPKIAQNTVTNCATGISFAIGQRANIENNQVLNTCTGIIVAVVQNAMVSHNRVSGHRDCEGSGVQLESVQGTTVDHNTIDGQLGASRGAITLNSAYNNNINANVLNNNNDNITGTTGGNTIKSNKCTSPSTNCNY